MSTCPYEPPQFRETMSPDCIPFAGMSPHPYFEM